MADRHGLRGARLVGQEERTTLSRALTMKVWHFATSFLDASGTMASTSLKVRGLFSCDSEQSSA